MSDENNLDILEESIGIFNSDESGFLTNLKTGLVLGPKGVKDLDDIKSGKEQESMTVLVTLNANGEVFPQWLYIPMRVYQLCCSLS